MLEIQNSFDVFMQTLNVNDVSQIRVNSRNLGFTQTWENKTKSPCAKEKCYSLFLSRSDLWMLWECHGIPRVYCYYFYLEPTVRKKTWMRTASVTVMVPFFESDILKVTWSQLYSKSLLKKYKTHWQHHFEKYPIALYFTDMDQHACKTSVNVTETRIDEGIGKTCIWKNIAPK